MNINLSESLYVPIQNINKTMRSLKEKRRMNILK